MAREATPTSEAADLLQDAYVKLLSKQLARKNLPITVKRRIGRDLDIAKSVRKKGISRRRRRSTTGT